MKKFIGNNYIDKNTIDLINTIFIKLEEYIYIDFPDYEVDDTGETYWKPTLEGDY